MAETLSQVKVGGKGKLVSASFTRPADTTAYAAGDVVSNATSGNTILTFADVGDDLASSGYIVGAKLLTDQATCVAQFRLFLFSASTATLDVDNGPADFLWADRASYLGYIDFPALSTEAGTNTAAQAQDMALRHLFVCGSTVTAIYGYLVTKTAFTPASAQNFRVELSVAQN